jgi:choline/glycine/proline betaine transport protein
MRIGAGRGAREKVAMSRMSDTLREHRQYIHPVVFPVAAVLIVAFVVFGAGFPDLAGEWLNETLGWITTNFAWFFVAAVAVFLIFCLWLMIGKPGHIRLGPDDSRPSYSYLTWFAMLFSAGMGIGLVFWGVAEPIFHYIDAPRVEGGTAEAARDAMVLTYHHWGLGAWAIYAILGLSLAYFGFRHNLPLTIRSAFYPFLGDRIHGWIGNLVDIVAILATMFGIATSLGLGAMQINAGLDVVFGVSMGTTPQIAIIAVITAIATVSVFSGLDRGIRRLSQVNIGLAAALLLFVALAGPTILILSAYVENIGGYVQNFVDTLAWSGTYEGEDWLAGWTIFYWAWWISWSPFVGMFIARISRGRTIREFVLGVLFVPVLVSFLWFSVFGNTAVHFQGEGIADIYGAMEAADFDASVAMFAMLEELPLLTLTSIVTILVIAIFFVTSSDSGSFVIDMIASGGLEDPPRSHRVFWAVAEGVVAASLLIAGGDAALEALQAGSVSTGLPFAIVLVFVMLGLIKGLRAETAGMRFDRIPDAPLVPQGDDRIEEPRPTPAGTRTRPGRGDAERGGQR